MSNAVNDINIGENEIIHWIEFDTSTNDLIDVDYILGKHSSFWANLHVFCIPECCGLNAFRFYSVDIENASTNINKKLLKDDLSELKQNLIASNQNVIISSELNSLIHKATFIKLLDHINKNL